VTEQRCNDRREVVNERQETSSNQGGAGARCALRRRGDLTKSISTDGSGSFESRVSRRVTTSFSREEARMAHGETPALRQDENP
jgi:hypothetical protein